MGFWDISVFIVFTVFLFVVTAASSDVKKAGTTFLQVGYIVIGSRISHMAY